MNQLFRKNIALFLTAALLMSLSSTAIKSQDKDSSKGKTRQRTRNNQSRIPDSVKVLRDLEYAKPNDTPLLLDLYLPPKKEDPLPLIVWIHGGAWRNGSKNRCPAIRFTTRGYAVASINYRLSDVAKFPAQIQDCKAAIRWLRAQAKQYHLDPKRIGVWGSSAGGHLVALLGTSGDVKELEGKSGNQNQSSRVQAVCDFYGPTDFLQMDAQSKPGSRINHDSPNSPESQLIGGPIQENKKKVQTADPITYVTEDDPPFLIMHGDEDPLVPLHQSQLLYNALKKTNVNVTLHVVKGGGHGFRGPEIDRRVNEFFDKYLKDKPNGQR